MKTEIEYRKDAMKWWNNLSLEEKFYKVIPYLREQGLDVTSRHPDTLTGSEIEKLFKKDHEKRT